MNVTMDQVKDMFDGVRDSFSVSRVFGEPISKDGVMIVPATRFAGGGGGGGGDGSHDRSTVDSGPDVAGGLGMGFGGVSKPAGALVTCTTGIAVAFLVWSLHSFGPRAFAFAFLVVWLPMAWLGLVSRVVVPRLPERYHTLRGFERDGHLYVLLGVRLVKRLLRRGPLAVFNPDLHLPTERTRTNLARLDQRIRDAEASHFILLVLTLGVVVNALVRRWWSAAGWTVLFDILMNGYPVMLQRYNRALLGKRFNQRFAG